MEFFIDAYRQYANFEGRANRQRFWMFYLFYIIFVFVISFIEAILGIGGFISGFFALASLIPTLAIAARRLHDIDKSGWWQLIVFIPIIGIIVLIIFFVKEGTVGANRFGEDPLAR
jgi:uncharacterized membrane protein YhaH (DUF805 family)